MSVIRNVHVYTERPVGTFHFHFMIILNLGQSLFDKAFLFVQALLLAIASVSLWLC